MKTKIILLLTLLASQFTLLQSETLQVKFDERIEFVGLISHYSIIEQDSRSAGYEPYIRDVDSCFLDDVMQSAFLSQFLIFESIYEIDRQLLFEWALSLKIDNGKIIAPVSNSPTESTLQKKFSTDDFNSFMFLLNDLYANISFEKFYNSQSDLYRKAEDIYKKTINKYFDLDILEDIHGVVDGEINIYLTMFNSGSYAIPHSNSMITDPFNTLFSNRLLVNHSLEIPNVIDKISLIVLSDDINKCEKKFKLDRANANYLQSSPVNFLKCNLCQDAIFKAQVVKLARLLYLEKVDEGNNQDIKSFGLDNTIMADKRCGFVWENELWEYLDVFKRNRDKYPSFKDYLPTLIYTYKELLQH